MWGDRLAWSTVVAVGAHAALFAFWPAMQADLVIDPDDDLLGMKWIALYALPSSGGGGTVPPPLAVIAEPDSLSVEVDVESSGGDSGVGTSDLALVRFSGGLWDRLAGRGGPSPSIVEPSPVSAPLGAGDDLPRDRASSPEVDVTVLEDLAAADDELLLETSPLDLSRLSAVRPQIVLPGTSAWILIRNPAEVDRFMNSVDDLLNSETEGFVDVAVWIDEWGSVEWAEISRSSGRLEMDEIALALFNEIASFRPARDRGVRVSMSVIFSVPFPW
jgi:TonB family protein